NDLSGTSHQLQPVLSNHKPFLPEEVPYQRDCGDDRAQAANQNGDGPYQQSHLAARLRGPSDNERKDTRSQDDASTTADQPPIDHIPPDSYHFSLDGAIRVAGLLHENTA